MSAVARALNPVCFWQTHAQNIHKALTGLRPYCRFASSRGTKQSINYRAVNRNFERLEHRMSHAEEKIDFFVRTALPPVEGIFYDGQIFDAYTFVSGLIRSAKSRIILFDNYVDDTVLTLLDKRADCVSAQIYTRNITQQLALDLRRHNAQYRPIAIDAFQNAHDRFLCIDDTVYHLGASLKDLGKKWFAFSRMDVGTDGLREKM